MFLYLFTFQTDDFCDDIEDKEVSRRSYFLLNLFTNNQNDLKSIENLEFFFLSTVSRYKKNAYIFIIVCLQKIMNTILTLNGDSSSICLRQIEQLSLERIKL